MRMRRQAPTTAASIKAVTGQYARKGGCKTEFYGTKANSF